MSTRSVFAYIFTILYMEQSDAAPVSSMDHFDSEGTRSRVPPISAEYKVKHMNLSVEPHVCVHVTAPGPHVSFVSGNRTLGWRMTGLTEKKGRGGSRIPRDCRFPLTLSLQDETT